MAKLPSPGAARAQSGWKLKPATRCSEQNQAGRGFPGGLNQGSQAKPESCAGRRPAVSGRDWNLSLPPQSRVGSGAWGCRQWVSHLRQHLVALGEAA